MSVNIGWKDVTVAVTGVMAVMAFLAAAGSVMTSDKPPWSSVERVAKEHTDMKTLVMTAKNELRADLYFSRIFNLRTAQCNAQKAGNQALSRTIAEQLLEAERVYMMLTNGGTVLIRPCSEF